MIYRKKSKLNISVTISIVIHALFITFLSYNVWQYQTNSGIAEAQSMQAIMLDTSIMEQTYQQEIQKEISTAKDNEEQKREQEKIKKAEVERLKVAQQQKQKEIEQAKKKAEQAKIAEEKAKKELEMLQQKKEKEKRAAEQAKAKAEKQANDAKRAREEKTLNDIIGNLTASKPAAKKGITTDEQNKYISLVQNAISNKFSNPSQLYNGRTCLLRIRINDDGLLLDVTSNGGDPALCRDAIAATRQATIPKPPKALYETVKSMAIEFRPM